MKVKCVHGDVITFPSAVVDLKINGWEGKIKVAVVPDVPVDVVLAWDDRTTCAEELKSMVTATTQRQLQEKTLVSLFSRMGIG